TLSVTPLDLYSQHSKSYPQKALILFLEILFLAASYFLMFTDAFVPYFGSSFSGSVPGIDRRAAIFVFSTVVFLRMNFMIFFLLKRRIPWGEAFEVPLAFAVYYLGFAFLVEAQPMAWRFLDLLGITLFAVGSYLNSASEWQRHAWKAEPENRGKLYTRGLFSLSMHVNYFGDVLWVSGYAVLTLNIYSAAIPAMLFTFFAFYNIPKLDTHLAEKYGEAFVAFAATTRKFVPWVY
ncbi:MAG TPA: DUF1295 domain-containing protein, partial [Turneriella sp.]|nr:DUF1295 domain-containing protein [Turneriella sp.]